MSANIRKDTETLDNLKQDGRIFRVPITSCQKLTSCQKTQDENLTIKQMRELWKNELLPQLKEELRSELRSEIEAENKCLYSEINAMSESLVNIEVSQTFISEKYDKLLEAIQTTKKQVQSMEKKIKDQGETASHLQDNVYDNVTSLDAMQQYLRRDCLEITGIPVLPIDKPKELVKDTRNQHQRE